MPKPERKKLENTRHTTDTNMGMDMGMGMATVAMTVPMMVLEK